MTAATVRTILGGLVVLWSLVVGASYAGTVLGALPLVVYNPSPSLKQGWYRQVLGPQRPPQPGAIVYTRTPDSFAAAMPVDWPHHHILKQVAGIGGMRVCWDRGAMTVETAQGPQRYPLHPAIVQRYPVQCQVLHPEDVLLVGTHPRSFDSRYVGPISAALIDCEVAPMWTWEGE